jgi:16S rRNA (adenine1518-N6/adenine1519-N6)-dimethyltransferase
MISTAVITRDDVVLEIGAGLGGLTCFLAQNCKRVIAVEVDPNLVKILRKRVLNLSNVDIIAGDILRVFVPNFNKVVSTPPYSISSPLLFWLLERRFDSAVLTFQKEFTERLTASVGSKNYGWLTVTTYYLAEVYILDSVSKNMFYPPPDVESVLVRLKPRKPPFSVRDRMLFFKLLRVLFTQRNRKVRNATVPFLLKRGIKRRNVLMLADSLPFHNKRVRELTPEDFGFLTNELIQKEKLYLT